MTAWLWAAWPVLIAWLVQGASVSVCLLRWQRITCSKLKVPAPLLHTRTLDRVVLRAGVAGELPGPLKDSVLDVLDAPSAAAGMARINEYLADVELETSMAEAASAWARVAMASGTAAALFVFAGGQDPNRIRWAGSSFLSGLTVMTFVLVLGRATRQRARQIREQNRALARRLRAVLSASDAG